MKWHPGWLLQVFEAACVGLFFRAAFVLVDSSVIALTATGVPLAQTEPTESQNASKETKAMGETEASAKANESPMSQIQFAGKYLMREQIVNLATLQDEASKSNSKLPASEGRKHFKKAATTAIASERMAFGRATGYIATEIGWCADAFDKYLDRRLRAALAKKYAEVELVSRAASATGEGRRIQATKPVNEGIVESGEQTTRAHTTEQAHPESQPAHQQDLGGAENRVIARELLHHTEQAAKPITDMTPRRGKRAARQAEPGVDSTPEQSSKIEDTRTERKEAKVHGEARSKTTRAVYNYRAEEVPEVTGKTIVASLFGKASSSMCPSKEPGTKEVTPRAVESTGHSETAASDAAQTRKQMSLELSIQRVHAASSALANSTPLSASRDTQEKHRAQSKKRQKRKVTLATENGFKEEVAEASLLGQGYGGKATFTSVSGKQAGAVEEKGIPPAKSAAKSAKEATVAWRRAKALAATTKRTGGNAAETIASGKQHSTPEAGRTLRKQRAGVATMETASRNECGKVKNEQWFLIAATEPRGEAAVARATGDSEPIASAEIKNYHRKDIKGSKPQQTIDAEKVERVFILKNSGEQGADRRTYKQRWNKSEERSAEKVPETISESSVWKKTSSAGGAQTRRLSLLETFLKVGAQYLLVPEVRKMVKVSIIKAFNVFKGGSTFDFVVPFYHKEDNCLTSFDMLQDWTFFGLVPLDSVRISYSVSQHRGLLKYEEIRKDRTEFLKKRQTHLQSFTIPRGCIVDRESRWVPYCRNEKKTSPCYVGRIDLHGQKLPGDEKPMPLELTEPDNFIRHLVSLGVTQIDISGFFESETPLNEPLWDYLRCIMHLRFHADSADVAVFSWLKQEASLLVKLNLGDDNKVDKKVALPWLCEVSKKQDVKIGFRHTAPGEIKFLLSTSMYSELDTKPADLIKVTARKPEYPDETWDIDGEVFEFTELFPKLDIVPINQMVAVISE